MSVIENLLQRFPDARQSGSEIKICCPFCHETGRHLYVNVNKLVFHCFHCGESGGIAKLAKEAGFSVGRETEESFMPTDEIAERYLRFVRSESLSVNVQDIPMPPGYFPFDKTTISEGLGKRCFEYLVARGFDENTVLSRRLGYCVSGPYRNRVILPIFEHGNLVYYTARSIGEEKPKYLNPPSGTVVRRDIIYNYDMGFWCDPVVICEGIFSAIAVGDNAIATLGKDATDEQIYRIALFGAKTIIVCYDPGAEGSAYAIARKLIGFCPNIKIAHLVDGDPNEVPKSHLREVLDSATTFTGWEEICHARRRR